MNGKHRIFLMSRKSCGNPHDVDDLRRHMLACFLKRFSGRLDVIEDDIELSLEVERIEVDFTVAR